MASAFLLAIGASVALKANARRYISVTYPHPTLSGVCNTGTTPFNCTPVYSELQCTVYDAASSSYRQAYLDDKQGFDDCMYPLYLH